MPFRPIFQGVAVDWSFREQHQHPVKSTPGTERDRLRISHCWHVRRWPSILDLSTIQASRTFLHGFCETRGVRFADLPRAARGPVKVVGARIDVDDHVSEHG